MTQQEIQTLKTLLQKYLNEQIASDRIYYADPTISANSDDLCDIDEMALYTKYVLDNLS